MPIRRTLAKAQAKEGILLVPPGTNFHVAAVLRAMLTSGTNHGDAALSAFDALVEQIMPAVDTTRTEAPRLRTTATWERAFTRNRPLPASRKHSKRKAGVSDAQTTSAFNQGRFLSTVSSFQQGCDDFSMRFAEGSKSLAQLVRGFAQADALGTDVLSLDSDRKAYSERWGTMYGPPSPKRTQTRKQAKAKAWGSLPQQLERDAADFAAAYFEFPTVKEWIEASVPKEERTESKVRNIYHIFTPFRKALELDDRPPFIVNSL
jgi:hypothetical protein